MNRDLSLNDPVWVIIDGKKYRGFYFGLTRYGLRHWVNAKPANKSMGPGWCVKLEQIRPRSKWE